MGKLARLLGADPGYPDHLIVLQATAVLGIMIWPWLQTLFFAFVFCFSVSLFGHIINLRDVFFRSPVFEGMFALSKFFAILIGSWGLPFMFYGLLWAPLRHEVCTLHPYCEPLYLESYSTPPDGFEGIVIIGVCIWASWVLAPKAERKLQ